MDDLIQRLTRELGVTPDQARGGLVALLRAGQKNLAPSDFEQVLAGVPGADQLLKNARPAGAMSSLAGGLGSLLGGKSGAGRWAGPGHSAILQEKKGDYLIYHAYDTEWRGVSTLRIAILRWDSEGWPTISN